MKREQVKLSASELAFLRSFKSSGKRSQREYDRVNILLLLHKGKKDAEIVDVLEVERTTVWRTRMRYLEEGVEKSLQEKERSGQPSKYGPKQKAEIIALACSDPPSGRARWTLELLTEKVSLHKGLESINRETIRLILKKTNVSLG
ncbi:MAG: Transposase [Ferruginibacter sp.]|nr:Transposase [Ferruginibacter sp.]